MNIWEWAKLAFSPKQPGIDFAFEAEIMAKRNELHFAQHRLDIAQEAFHMLRDRKKRSSDAFEVARARRNDCLRLEMEIRELEKCRG